MPVLPMEYNVNPNKTKPMILVLALTACGIIAALLPAQFKELPRVYCQGVAAVFLGVAVLLLSRFLMTDYSYQLYDARNMMSDYPKLNIYRVKKTSSKMAYCIPFNNIIGIHKMHKIRKLPMKRENLCASFCPRDIYAVIYFIDGAKEAVYIECNEAFAQEIRNRIRVWSEVTHMDEQF